MVAVATAAIMEIHKLQNAARAVKPERLRLPTRQPPHLWWQPLGLPGPRTARFTQMPYF